MKKKRALFLSVRFLVLGLVVFGGSLLNGIGSDSSISAKWVQLFPDHSPSGRIDYAMAYDSDLGVVILFGGYDRNISSALNDTWKWDGIEWTELFPSTKPPARRAHYMVYDSIRKKIVMFGGSTGTGGGDCFDDTWEWDGSDWTRVSESGPSARFGHGMAFDSIRGKVVLFGGYPWKNDTWEWDGTSWEEKTPVGPSPVAQNRPRLIYNEARAKVFLYSGISHRGYYPNEMWEWDGVQWVQLFSPTLPLARGWHAMAFNSDMGIVVMFGGWNSNYIPNYLDDTWEWNWSNWIEKTSSPSPAPRDNINMIYDKMRQEILLFGGGDDYQLFNDTWVYRSWVNVSIDIKPGNYPNTINLGSNGNVPVAIFSTDEFDATSVDPLSVSLAGAEVRFKGKGNPMASFEDVNYDGLLDMIVHVDTRALDISPDDTEGILEGKTYSGMTIRGVDTVRILE